MYLKSLELNGFKSFGKKSLIEFTTAITAVVGPNGSGKSNTAESFRFVLGEQSLKSMRGKRGEDLIWGGSSEVPRSNRASVKLTFDNRTRLLNVDLDEVVIERTVYRDGANEYVVNGSKVRLKDVTELLAAANIGSSGHHIISQGEADRVLAASPRERKQMVEDALGLRVYQYKKDESLRKLLKTEENKAQVEALRRENAPHLKFLERQMKKIERARELRTELIARYKEYLKREELYLAESREALSGLREEPTQKLRVIDGRVRELRELLEKAKKGDKESETLLAFERDLSLLRREIAEYTRALGRIEGQVTFEERRLEEEARKIREEEGKPVPYRDVYSLLNKLTHLFDSVHGKNGEQLRELTSVVREAQALVRKFIERYSESEKEGEVDTSELERLRLEKKQLEARTAEAVERMAKLETSIRDCRVQAERDTHTDREHERELYAAMAEQTELRASLSRLDMRAAALSREEEEFKHEISEGIALIGRAVMEYKGYELPDAAVDLTDLDKERERQAERRRELEKTKIRLEEVGGASAEEVTKEYEVVRDRDAFLERELSDLTVSEESLRKLIGDLENELSERFSRGVADISKQFSEFFTLMFGGGSATLRVVAEKKRGVFSALLLGEEKGEEDGAEQSTAEEGIEVEVSLPKKRVQSLMMLSGGERTLTSIALIFAMSQVNPPPFIILDETDAALDEANSKRYGDMIATLAEKSQLIVITHNRETMSRAGVLYGITMGLDGVSKVLSVKFEEATAVAK